MGWERSGADRKGRNGMEWMGWDWIGMDWIGVAGVERKGGERKGVERIGWAGKAQKNWKEVKIMAENKKGEIEKIIEIPKMRVGAMHVRIRGTAPIIFQRWTEKATRMIVDKQMKKAKTAREAREPEKEYEDSFYRNTEGKICFPALCIKRALVDSARFVEGVKMTILRGAVFIKGDSVDDKGSSMIVVSGEKGKKLQVEMRTDQVRLSGIGATSDLRFRGQAQKWEMMFTVEFNASLLSENQILNLLVIAGRSNGLGEWRIERGGDFGSFEVLNA